jgi:hypothetical protein
MLGTWNVRGDVSGTSWVHEAIPGSVKDEGGNPDRWQHVPNIDLDVHAV